MRLTNGTGMISAGAAASTASAMKIGRTPAATPSGSERATRGGARLSSDGGHSAGSSVARVRIEPLQHAGARSLRLEQKDVLDQARARRPPPAPCASSAAIARAGSSSSTSGSPWNAT